MMRPGHLTTAAFLTLAALVTACSSPDRLAAVPPGRTVEATIPGIPDARYWPGDRASMQRMVDVYEEEILKEEAAGATVDAAGNLLLGFESDQS